MKRLFLLAMIMGIMVSGISVSAEEYFETEVDEFDGIALMSMYGDEYDELERRVLNAYDNFETQLDVSDMNLTRDEFDRLYTKILYEHPIYYYVAHSYGGKTIGDIVYLVEIRYETTDREEIEESYAQIEAAVDEILLYINPEMSDLEKVLAVHDYMVLNYVYDLSNTDQTLRMLITRNGVCAGYTEAFEYVMEILGIECDIVRSPDMAHMWNIVELGGKWYHIDLTWDDVIYNGADAHAMVHHEYALLSDEALRNDVNPHYGYDVTGYTFGNEYDNAPWRNTTGCIVSVDGVMYYVSGNRVVDENGNDVSGSLSTQEGMWNVGIGTLGGNYAGLCELNGMLYFNTDSGIKSYNPVTKAVKEVLNKTGICGVYTDENVLRYNKFHYYYAEGYGQFLEGGEVRLDDMKLAYPTRENGSIVVRCYLDTDDTFMAFSKGDIIKNGKLDKRGINKVIFNNGESQEIFLWDSNMKPVENSVTIK